MRKILSLLLPVFLITACSTPKYTYHFDYYDYQSGKKSAQVQADEIVSNPLEAKEADFVASAEIDAMVTSVPPASAAPEKKLEGMITKDDYLAMDKSEKKALRKEIKKEMKTWMKNGKKTDTGHNLAATTEMDRDLKLAIIFGAVGLTLSLFSGINAAFWVLGVIAIVIGVVFLIRWLVRQ